MILFPLLRGSGATLKRVAESGRQPRDHPTGSTGATACRAQLDEYTLQAHPLLTCRLVLLLLGLQSLEEDAHALGEEVLLRGGGLVTLELFLSLRCLVDGRVLRFCHGGFLQLNAR